MKNLKNRAIRYIQQFSYRNDVRYRQLKVEEFDINKHDILCEPDYRKVENKLLKNYIDKALSSLYEKERKIVIVRHGLTNNTPLTLEETGKMFGITQERTRQIEAKALEKIRQSEYAKILQEFMP